MSTRLTPVNVERQISEMWDAVAAAPLDEDYPACYAQAHAAEAKLRAALLAQERLHDAAPGLLAACKAAIEYAEACRELPEFSDGLVLSYSYEKMKAAIAKAEGRDNS